jgi:hypothetical protein
MKIVRLLKVMVFLSILLYALAYGQMENSTAEINPSVPQNLVDICQYADQATATSENTGSEAIYATGVPDCDTDCSVWSGIQKSWNPTNWNTIANLTLHYPSSVSARNLTFHGDYDICVRRIWVSNSIEQLEVFSGEKRDCTFTMSISAPFDVDKIILETCGYSWTSTDAVQLCGKVCLPSDEICDGVDNDCDAQVDEGLDQDSDEIADCFDNCPDARNQDQADSDSDGVGDACDRCQGSSSEEEVDQNGCDIFQFCEPFYCSFQCLYADWKGNEPLQKYPNDCTIVLKVREGGYEPACVPTIASDQCAN